MLRDLAAIATLAGVGWLIIRVENLMSAIDDVNAAIDRNDAAQTEALNRVAEDVAELRRKFDEGQDLSGIVERLEQSTARLQAVDPDPSFPATPGDDTPTEPAL